MSRQTTPELEQLPLWKHFQAKAAPHDLVRTQRLVSIAKEKLRQVRDTFPNYTLHDHEHADNVIWLMGELLGDRLSSLTALDAHMLILAAYFHDAGMAFSEAERRNLHNDPEFRTFLDEHPAALLAVEKPDGPPPPDVAEWFCRSLHAERVVGVLHAVHASDPSLLVWETQDLTKPLADLCRSHNLDIAELRDDERFPASFRYDDCDIRFCAILLRLADILDFDRVRTPDQLYRYLRLGERNDKPARTSDLEWRKHLASEGFRFPPASAGPRRAGYAVGYLAGPAEPAVEHDIRHFLDAIDIELVRCASLQRSCSDRFRDLPLPARVDRTGIKSNGYTYGEHRFTLDQEQVLNLLMGENLYDNPYAFVRELLQNALDTSRHREFHERSKGSPAFRCSPINVSTWADQDGYCWVQIEDSGMGMTERIINDFLLKVGRSYYNSPQFEADVIRYTTKTSQTFKPISRFGIGLLSCFVAGDRIEIATRHADAPDGPLRLCLPGLQNFFILQK